MSSIDLLITPIVNKLNDLSEHGFVYKGPIKLNDGKIIHNWERSIGWKKERIQLFHYSKEPKWCEVTLWLYLLINNMPCLLTHDNVSKIMHSETQYKFPLFLKKLRATGFIEKVVEDILHSMLWFDNKTRQECLKVLESDNTSINKDSTVYQNAIDLLQREQ